MPIFDANRIDLSSNVAPYVKGDMIIKFNIIFPKVMTQEFKNSLSEILC